MGDGPLVWHEEAREGGVLTVAKEALRCSARNFSPIAPPATGQHHPMPLTPALQFPLLAPEYNHTVRLSSLPSLQSLECSKPSSSASGHNPEVQLQYLYVPAETFQCHKITTQTETNGEHTHTVTKYNVPSHTLKAVKGISTKFRPFRLMAGVVVPP